MELKESREEYERTDIYYILCISTRMCVCVVATVVVVVATRQTVRKLMSSLIKIKKKASKESRQFSS